MAVMNVFWALMTMIGRSGRSFLMRGKRSKAFSSGITTSVMMRSPSPWLTHRHSVAAFPVERTSYPARDSAWFNTVRTAASSSAIKMLPAGISITSGFSARLGVVTRELGHEHAKDCPPRLRLAFDNAAVIADDLGGKRKTKSAAGRLGGYEGIEQIRHQVVGHARAVVLDAEFERQRNLRLAARERQAHTGPEGSGELDFAISGGLANRLGGILDEVEEHLDELVTIGEHRRQRGIIFFDKPDVSGEAGLGKSPHVIENHVDIDLLAFHRPLVAEHFHAIDQLDDAVGLIADQPGQDTVVIACLLLQELRCAANA